MRSRHTAPTVSCITVSCRARSWLPVIPQASGSATSAYPALTAREAQLADQKQSQQSMQEHQLSPLQQQIQQQQTTARRMVPVRDAQHSLKTADGLSILDNLPQEAFITPAADGAVVVGLHSASNGAVAIEDFPIGKVSNLEDYTVCRCVTRICTEVCCPGACDRRA